MRLMEWCYVVCSHERLRGHRPAVPAAVSEEAIVMPLERGSGTRAHAQRGAGSRLNGEGGIRTHEAG